ncbi:polysaccharide deacetylase family protein [Solwaraspora sp. WMMB335]|uniref:polysaccharide deacetylase family protein n=1 Tax=Solwaraspora sp. WMMB335 TaxID=3404118 RepID=UPI003B92A66C
MAVLASPRGLTLAALTVTVVLAGAFVIGYGTAAENRTSPTPSPAPAPVPSRNVPDPDLGRPPSLPAATTPQPTAPVVPSAPLAPTTPATAAGPDPPVGSPPSTGLPPYDPIATDRSGPFGTRRTSGSAAIALTFDDGPHPVHTRQILDVLRRYRVTATFCLIGQNVVRYPDLVRAIADDGHTLCNHSWNHDFDLGSRSRAAIRADLIRTSAAIQDATGGRPVSYFRQPGGFWTPAVVGVARELGMASLHWSIDPADYFQPGAGSITATVTAQAVPGSVVLLHDAGGDRTGTVLALRSILPNLQRRFLVDALPPMAEPAEQRSRRLHLKTGQL